MSIAAVILIREKMNQLIVHTSTNNMAALFEGQGAQFVGMGKSLYQQYPYVRDLFDEASDVLGFNMKKLCFEDLEHKLNLTEYTQPALLTVETASYLVLKKELGWKPSYLAGHSLGEITSLVCGGAITFGDGVGLVKLRGKYMQEAVPNGKGTMLVVRNCDPILLKEQCLKINKKGYQLSIANYNSIDQCVISGEFDAVEIVIDQLRGRNIWNKKLNVSGPFHNPLMESAAQRLKEDLDKIVISDLEIPVISNVTALPYIEKTSIKEHIIKQIVCPVEWVKCIKYLLCNNTFDLIDMGPGQVLKKLANGLSQVRVYSFEEGMNYLSNQHCNKKQDRDIKFMEECVRIAVCTPNYNQSEEQLDYIILLKNIKARIKILKEKNEKPSKYEVEQAYEMLRQVMKEKLVPGNEETMRFNDLHNSYQF
ncbi:ACP S-malonyltransferase [Anaerosporobacter sp.]